MVKQFSNNALDNLFNFAFRWVDFGKVLLEAFWSFLYIWQAFFAIFSNLFMYIYYLFLFFIDRGSEGTTMPRLFRPAVSGRRSSTPSLDLSGTDSAPSRIASAAKSVVETASSAVSSSVSSISSVPLPQNPAKSGQKSKILKTFGEGVIGFFIALWETLKKPGVLIREFFTNKMKPVKDTEQKAEKRSLIDEYLQEYEKQRK
jgi:hypothetical protein